MDYLPVPPLPLTRGSAGETHLRLRSHDEATFQSFGVAFKQSSQDFYLVVGALVLQAQKDDAPVRALLPEYLLAEVLVVGNQDPVLGERFLDEVIVVGPRASS